MVLGDFFTVLIECFEVFVREIIVDIQILTLFLTDKKPDDYPSSTLDNTCLNKNGF